MSHVDKELKKYGISLVLSVSNVFIDTSRVGGYFDDYNKQLVVYFDECFLDVLVHEFCHFKQWKEDCKVWRELGDSLDLMWKWLRHEIELDKQTLNFIFEAVSNLEKDCERRAVKLIKKYDLEIDLEKYIRSANTYLHFYDYVKEHRVWMKEEQGIESFVQVLSEVDCKEVKKSNPNIYKLFDYYF